MEETMKIEWQRSVVAGVLGTAVMTAVGLWVAPLMGIPAMNPAQMLAGVMGGVQLLGWAAHFMIGTALAFAYAGVSGRLPGPPLARGALFSLAPWLLAQTLVLPMMGMPPFSGAITVAAGSLIGHMMYGAVVGRIYGARPALAFGLQTQTTSPRPSAAPRHEPIACNCGDH
jgi:hypothetical protein